ncbi:hypothetical protein [Komarekiella delphini-convector]|nr:hypothetical protein [Komarekiella delphini-convector]
MSTAAAQIPVNTIIPIFTAIGDRQWQVFKDLEKALKFLPCIN